MPYSGDYTGSCPRCDHTDVRQAHHEEKDGVKLCVYICVKGHTYEVSYEGTVIEDSVRSVGGGAF